MKKTPKTPKLNTNPNPSSLHEDFILNGIESGSTTIFGDGAFKDVFEHGGFVYLKETVESYRKPIDFYALQKKVRMLKDGFGISIADLVYHKFAPSKIRPNAQTYYEVQERMPGHGVEMFQAHQFIRYMKEKYSKTFEGENAISNFYVPPEIEIEMQKENLIALKERVLCGQKFLPKAFRDHVILSGLNILDDINGENILFDPNKGYSFIDLTMDQFPSGVETPEDVEKYLHSLYSSWSEFVHFNKRSPKIQESRMLRPNIYSSFFRAIVQPASLDFSQGVEPFIYKSILFAQAKNMIIDYAQRTNFDDMSVLENAFDKYSRKFLIEETLHDLADTLTKGNGIDPHVAKSILFACWNNNYGINLDKNTDFNTQLDANAFLAEMQTLSNPELDYDFKKAADFSMVGGAEDTLSQE